MGRARLIATLLAAAAALSATGASAQRANILPNVNAALDRLYISCTVEQRQELIITNTTGAPIPANTAIWFNVKAAGQPDQTEYVYREQLAVGASFRIPLRPADSCTAWLKVTPMMAPD